MALKKETRKQHRWMWLSAALLLLYLAFFHLCLGASYQTCVTLGVSGWLIWSIVCYRSRAVFLNRFEYWIHQLVGIDILFEGFSPLHEGYGFYICASCFWAVFLSYRFICHRRTVANSLLAETDQRMAGEIELDFGNTS